MPRASREPWAFFLWIKGGIDSYVKNDWNDVKFIYIAPPELEGYFMAPMLLTWCPAILRGRILWSIFKILFNAIWESQILAPQEVYPGELWGNMQIVTRPKLDFPYSFLNRKRRKKRGPHSWFEPLHSSLSSSENHPSHGCLQCSQSSGETDPSHGHLRYILL